MRQQSGSKSFILSKLFTITGFVLLILLVLALTKNYLQKQRVNSEVLAMQQEISQLQKGNKELSSVIDYLQTSDFLEAQARTKFGMAKNGEQVVVIAGGPDSASGAAKNDSTESAGVSVSGGGKTNPGKWWNYFWQ